MAASNAITHEASGGDFPVDVLTFALSSGHIAQLPIVISVPEAGLRGRDASGKAPLEIYAYTFDDQGQMVDYFVRNAAIDTVRQPPGHEGLVVSGTCHVLAGRYRVKVYVRNAVDGRFGFRATPVDVPDFGAARLQALPPVFLRTRGSGPPYLRGPRPSAEETDPFTIAGASFVPDVSPTLAPNSNPHVCLMVVRTGRTGDAGSVPPFEVEVRIVDADGKVIVPSDVHVLGRTPPTADGLVQLLLDFTASNLAPGQYAFRVTFRDSRDGSLQSQNEARFQVS